jgi:hypothetical protein
LNENARRVHEEKSARRHIYNAWLPFAASQYDRIASEVRSAPRTSKLGSFDRLPRLILEGKKRASETGKPVLVSSSERISTDLNPLDLFAASTRLHDESYYWGTPVDNSWTVGASTEADITVEGPDRFQRAKVSLQELFNSSIVDGEAAGPIFIGGFRFDHTAQVNGNWSGFFDGLLSLPRIMISCRPPDLWSTLNVFVKSGTDVESTHA